MTSYIQRYGNQLVLVLSGERYTALPTSTDVWVLNGAESGPGPGPGPAPGDQTFDWPFNPSTEVTSEYGPRDGRIHQGIDFGKGTAIAGANLLASAAGTVYNDTSVFHGSNDPKKGFGWHIIINHGSIGGRQLYTLYAHMLNASPFAKGEDVAKGSTVGILNNTGGSYGAHLHWETHVANPGSGPTWSNPGTHLNPRTFMDRYQNIIVP
jgi:murein DD-endopeptidase MepM/ murein hydrolase activator NlpD